MEKRTHIHFREPWFVIDEDVFERILGTMNYSACVNETSTWSVYNGGFNVFHESMPFGFASEDLLHSYGYRLQYSIDLVFECRFDSNQLADMSIKRLISTAEPKWSIMNLYSRLRRQIQLIVTPWPVTLRQTLIWSWVWGKLGQSHVHDHLHHSAYTNSHALNQIIDIPTTPKLYRHTQMLNQILNMLIWWWTI